MTTLRVNWRGHPLRCCLPGPDALGNAASHLDLNPAMLAGLWQVHPGHKIAPSMSRGTVNEYNGSEWLRRGMRTRDLPAMSHSVRSHLRLEIDTYDETIRRFIPGYEEGLIRAARVVAGVSPALVLDLGAGTGALGRGDAGTRRRWSR